jgi:hypothetical protein
VKGFLAQVRLHSSQYETNQCVEQVSGIHTNRIGSTENGLAYILLMQY